MEKSSVSCSSEKIQFANFMFFLLKQNLEKIENVGFFTFRRYFLKNDWIDIKNSKANQQAEPFLRNWKKRVKFLVHVQKFKFNSFQKIRLIFGLD